MEDFAVIRDILYTSKSLPLWDMYPSISILAKSIQPVRFFAAFTDNFESDIVVRRIYGFVGHRNLSRALRLPCSLIPNSV